MKHYFIRLAFAAALAGTAAHAETIAFSGHAQSTEFPPGEMYSHKLSTFVGKLTYHVGPNDGSCNSTNSSGPYSRVTSLLPDSLSITLRFSDGNEYPASLSVDTYSKFFPATLAVKTFCNGSTAIGQTTMQAIGINGIRVLNIVFDDGAAPLFSPPFKGAFTQTRKFRPSVFQFNPDDDPANGAEGDSYSNSTLVTCLTPLSSPDDDPALSACGSPAPVIRAPSPKVYVYSGVAEDVSGQPANPRPGARFLGQFTLDSSLLFNKPNSYCSPDDLNLQWAGNDSYTIGAGLSPGEDSVRVFLPDGRQGFFQTVFNPSPSLTTQLVTGFCNYAKNGSNTAIGPTRLYLSSGVSALDIRFDDAPPNAIAVANPFNGILPTTSKFKQATVFLQGLFDPVELLFDANPLSGRVTCLAPLANPGDDIMTSPCAAGLPAAKTPPGTEPYTLSVLSLAGKGATIATPSGLAWRNGSLYVSSADSILRVDSDGSITTFAGGNGRGNSGDGGPASGAQFGFTGHLAFANDGSLFVADTLFHVIRKIATDGTISTVAGTGTMGSTADGASAVSAAITRPSSLLFDQQNLLYFVEGNRLRQIAADGTLKTLGANLIKSVEAASADQGGNVLFAGNGKMFRIASTDGTVSTLVRGVNPPGFSGDGDQALKAGLGQTGAIVTDATGNVYLLQDSGFLRKINTAGIIKLVAGFTIPGTRFIDPIALAVDDSGRVYVADSGSNRILVLTPNNN